MSRRCTVCDSERRDDIDRQLATSRTPLRRIATENQLSESALRRHHRHHLPATLARAVATAEDVRASDLLDDVDALRAEAKAILDEARRGDKPDLALKAIQRLEKLAELLARLKGLVDHHGTAVNVNVTTSNHYQAIEDVQSFQRLLERMAVSQAGLPPARAILEAPAGNGAAPIEDLEA